MTSRDGHPPNIAVVTGSRAEYGLLRGVMLAIEADTRLKLQTIVTGAHLSPHHGDTWREIADDGIAIVAKVDIGVDEEDSARAVAAATGAGITRLAAAMADLNPDLVLLLGDRYEILAAAVAALIANIPVGHIHGGEVTEGAIDDAMRHAITKMSSLHFAAAAPYARRIIQLGEDPARVFDVGALGLDAVAGLNAMSRHELESALDFSLTGGPVLLTTFHPETAGATSHLSRVDALLEALDSFSSARIVFTGVNADVGNREIRRAIESFVRLRPHSAHVSSSLGQRRYLSMLAIADVVVGNSSSGIIEAPALKVPTVNIGNRQAGRLRAASIIDCGPESEEIRHAIQIALSPAFRRQNCTGDTPYGRAGAAARIVEILATAQFAALRRKRFHDVPAAA